MATYYVTDASVTVQVLDTGYVVQVVRSDERPPMTRPHSVACRTLDEVLEAVRAGLEPPA